ncbi:MAG: DNA polymerase ligase N-terminal domain-containing protein [bacterium]
MTERVAHLQMLLEPGFDTFAQQVLWEELRKPLRFVIKLHDATNLHYDFRLELFGTLFSLAMDDPPPLKAGRSQKARRVGDHNPRYLLSERCIPEGQYGAGPTLVWDKGEFKPKFCTEETEELSVYKQLLNGQLDFELDGARVKGLFRLTGHGENWRLTRLSEATEQHQEPNDMRSVISGKSLDEIRAGVTAKPPFVLALDWKRYYVDDTIDTPEVAMKHHKAFDMNTPAWMRGVAPGMQLHQIHPLAPGCVIRKWHPDKERAEGWLNLCTPFSSRIEPIEEHLAMLDLTEHPEPISIARLAIRTLSKEPYGKLTYGAAPCKWIATLAAAQGHPLDYMPDPAGFLAPLPIDRLLPVAPADRERLQFLGYCTIRDVAQIPTKVLWGQFGSAALMISGAASGRWGDEVQAVFPANRLSEPFFFDEPIADSQTLQVALDQVSEKLANRLAGHQTGRMTLRIDCEGGVRMAAARDFKRPVYDLGGIRAAVHTLAAMDGGPASPITNFVVDLGGIEPVRVQQTSFFLAKDRPLPDANIAAIQAALGENAVVKATEIKRTRRELVLKEWRHATGWN